MTKSSKTSVAIIMFNLVVIAAAGFGMWAGFSRASGGPPIVFGFHVAMTLAWGSLLVFGGWLWHRAAPGSGDAMVLSLAVPTEAAMFVGVLPKVIWPESSSIGTASSLVSLGLVTILVVRSFADRRRTRASRG